MSSLFADAMRAAIYCNVSGCPPETDEQMAARKKRETALCLDYFDYGYECTLPKGHEGDHLATGEDWEMKWRPTA